MNLVVRPGLLVSAALLGAGVASAVTALATYFGRYSSFDALMGEIDDGLYVQITRMAPAEEGALFVGVCLIIASGALLGLVALLERRSDVVDAG